MKQYIPLTPSDESIKRITARVAENRPFKKRLSMTDIERMYHSFSEHNHHSVQSLMDATGYTRKEVRYGMAYLLRFKLIVTKRYDQ